jgi:hypothetical protein
MEQIPIYFNIYKDDENNPKVIRFIDNNIIITRLLVGVVINL